VKLVAVPQKPVIVIPPSVQKITPAPKTPAKVTATPKKT
jgi:hypothetical protein